MQSPKLPPKSIAPHRRRLLYGAVLSAAVGLLVAVGCGGNSDSDNGGSAGKSTAGDSTSAGNSTGGSNGTAGKANLLERRIRQE
jgi:hypothetical protein